MLSASDVRLAFGHQNLLDGVTLTVEPGEKVGLVGRNGCGKTSLLRILSGQLLPDAGLVSRQRGLRVGLLPQEFELEGARTVRENIEAGATDLIEWLRRYEAGDGSEAELAELHHRIDAADGWNLRSRTEAVATALGVPPMDGVVGVLSGGERRRVALCRALASQPDVLLLDEPTNHLDAESIRWLEGFLREFPGAVIFVTHDRYFLDVIATRILELADGRCYSHPGNYTAYLEAKAVRQQIAEQSERRRQRFLRVELEWVRAGVRAQRSKARHRLETYYAVAGLEAPVEEREMDLLIPPAAELGNTVVELENAGVRVGEGAAERWLFRGLQLSIKPGQCTGVVGRNGAGKTTLLRLCMGAREPDLGTVKIGTRVVVNYVDQGRMQLNEDATLLEEIAEGRESIPFGNQKLSARAYARRFLFTEERVRETVRRLSGGERARLMLAKVLKHGGNLLVLDEPTNDLDLPSLRMLEEALVDFDGAVLVVSHDRYFLDRICDQIVAFEDNGVFVQPGNYSYYLERKLAREAPLRPPPLPVARPTPKPASAVARPARARGLGFKEQRELAGMESAIAAGELRVRELEELLANPGFYARRGAEAPQRLAELEQARAEVARLYERWQELDAKAGG